MAEETAAGSSGATPTRRAINKSVLWATPIIVASTTAAATAASKVKATYGLFVSAASSGDNGYGYMTGNNAQNPLSSDLNWNDSTGHPSGSTTSYTNGSGVFTPYTNSATGTDGSYGSSSGFWWSTPLSASGTPIKGATATLKAGATFVTDVTFTVPAGPNAQWVTQNVKINGQAWTKAASGSVTYLAGTNRNQIGRVAGKWTTTVPIVTTNADKSLTFKATITFKTDADATITSKTGGETFGQVHFMPGSIQVPRQYGLGPFRLTSWASSATVTYSTGSPVTFGPRSLEQSTFIVLP